MCSKFHHDARRLIAIALVLVPYTATGGTGSTTQTLAATINPSWTLSSPSSTSMARGQQPFQPFQAVVALDYRARTTASGSGRITLQVTGDFLPAGGPSAAAGALSYTCSAATLGAACSGTQTASTNAQTPVLLIPASACTGGGGDCSGHNPNSVHLNFSLQDDPVYPTGSYAATLTFTISAL